MDTVKYEVLMVLVVLGLEVMINNIGIDDEDTLVPHSASIRLLLG